MIIQTTTLAEVADGSPLRMNTSQAVFAASLRVLISGTLTCSAQFTLDDPLGTYTNSFGEDADWIDVDSLSDITASAVSNLAYPVTAVRLSVSAFTSGSAKLTVVQSQ